MKNFLQNKTVVITGGASGLGAALAKASASAGANLALLDINNISLEKIKQEINSNYSVKVSVHNIDVGNESNWVSAVSGILSVHGKIDVLINNAGITLTPTPFEKINHDLFDKVIHTNLLGAMYAVRYCLPNILESKTGGIINISSLGGRIGLYGYAPYSMSKFALRGLGESLQMEFAGSSHHCMNVFPGGIKTNIIQHAPNLTNENAGKAHLQFQRMAFMKPEKAATLIINAFRNKRHCLILGADAKFALRIHWLLGNKSLKILKKIFEYQEKILLN